MIAPSIVNGTSDLNCVEEHGLGLVFGGTNRNALKDIDRDLCHFRQKTVSGHPSHSWNSA